MTTKWYAAVLLSCLSLLFLAACAGPRARVWEEGASEVGEASWYGPGFHGRRTASGEVYDMHQLTAAHPELPHGSVVEVTNLDNGKTVEVRINDRGPFVGGRVIDLSYAAARAIGLVGPGVARVRVQLTRFPAPEDRPPSPQASGGYSVQVGSFVSRENAEALKASLSRIVRETYIVEKTLRDVTVYRVRVGSYRSRRDAAAAAAVLAEEGHVSIIIEREGNR